MTLRVLLNAGPRLGVPPDGYGGIENVIATLIPELCLGTRRPRFAPTASGASTWRRRWPLTPPTGATSAGPAMTSSWAG
jgi:hypothetical protein